MTLEDQIKNSIRDVENFPKQGILFKDITPLLKNPGLSNLIAEEVCKRVVHLQLDAIACVESRGFWFGMLIAQKLNIPFIPIRKLGKLPYETNSYTYELEYGKATMEIHTDALKKGWKVLIHDDLLATGGTASAAAELVKIQNAVVAGFAFIVKLSFLSGDEKLEKYCDQVISLVTF